MILVWWCSMSEALEFSRLRRVFQHSVKINKKARFVKFCKGDLGTQDVNLIIWLKDCKMAEATKCNDPCPNFHEKLWDKRCSLGCFRSLFLSYFDALNVSFRSSAFSSTSSLILLFLNVICITLCMISSTHLGYPPFDRRCVNALCILWTLAGGSRIL